MKKNITKIIIGIILVVIVTIVFNFVYDRNQPKMVLDSANKYIIETDFGFDTMMNDGGSHTDIYYEIDLDEKIVKKVSEYYDYQNVGPGGNPKVDKKVWYEKNIDVKIEQEIKNVCTEAIEKEDINDSKNYHCFVIKTDNQEKLIYNSKTIEKLRKLLEKIDEL